MQKPIEVYQKTIGEGVPLWRRKAPNRCRKLGALNRGGGSNPEQKYFNLFLACRRVVFEPSFGCVSFLHTP
jgi:hypothetical protein